PVSINSTKSWKAGPGLKDTLQDAFHSQINVPNLIPLFVPYNVPNNMDSNYASSPQAKNFGLTKNNGDPLPYTAASDQGQGATYAIAGFVGVTITQAEGNGSNMIISIQPCAI